jgi:hypothetical protein
MLEDHRRNGPMKRLFAPMLALGAALGAAGAADAQVSVSIGNPYRGFGARAGSPYYSSFNNYGVPGYTYGTGYYGAPGVYAPGYSPGAYAYSSAYSDLNRPYRGSYYSSGYAGYAPAARTTTAYGASYRPYVRSYTYPYAASYPNRGYAGGPRPFGTFGTPIGGGGFYGW